MCPADAPVPNFLRCNINRFGVAPGGFALWHGQTGPTRSRRQRKDLGVPVARSLQLRRRANRIDDSPRASGRIGGSGMSGLVTSPTDSERPTLKTIAAATGLAIATVSRALKDAPDIGEETKRRVRETAERLGYRPNRAGVRLRTGKTNVIALTLSTEADVLDHTSHLIYSIAEALRGSAYHLVVMPFFADQDPMDPIRYIVETGSADGVLMNQTRPDDPRVRYLADHSFPFATHGRTDMGVNHPYFDFDNEAFARLGVRELAKRGRKRLLLVPPPRAHSYAGHMIAGFADEAALQGLTFEVMEAVNSDSGAGAIEAALRDRMAAAPPVDGILFLTGFRAVSWRRDLLPTSTAPWEDMGTDWYSPL